MTNGPIITSTSLSLLAGSTALARLALPTARVCQLPTNILFDHARSLVEPTPQNKKAFQNLLTRLNIGGTQRLLLITGHTDSNGTDQLNEELSDRRVQAVRAVLRDQPDVWEDLSVKDEKGWGVKEFTIMAGEVGETNVSRFLGPANKANREGLFRRYFAKLLGGKTVPAFQTTTPDVLAFGEEQLLHGDKSNPSRDITLPPITGDFDKNRRSEFFLFADPPPPILRSEYPTWIGECSLVPPAPAAPITVTITPVESVRKNQITEIQITLTPAVALPSTSSVELKLSTTAGTGEARFDTNSDTKTIRASEKVKVRGVAESSQLDNIRLTATVVGQAGTGAQEDFTVVDNIFIHLQFEVFKLTPPSGFVTLPAGITIDIMHDDTFSTSTIVGKQTDANGGVFFNLPDLSASGKPNPDIFFLARTNGLSHADHTLPKEWSTKGWLAADNITPGLQTAFTGPTLGTPSAPVVFRVGLDFHAQLQYHVDAGARVGKDDPAPRGVFVALMQEEVGLDRTLLKLQTGDKGLIDGVSFDAEPGRTFYLFVNFEMEDSDIHLKKARFAPVSGVPPIIDIVTPAGPSLFWESNENDDDNNDIKNNRSTSIGTVAAPRVFLCKSKDRNVALYILKVLRELGLFLFKMTQGDWQGVEVAVTPTAPKTAFSWPVNRIQLNFPDDRWARETVTHEMGHQVMWGAVDFSTVGVFYEASLGQLQLNHREDLMANPEQALIEGWAEFVEAIFQSTATPLFSPFPSTPPYSVQALVEPPLIPFTTPPPVPGGLGPPPLNRGELVEGALANGLWAIFDKHVAALPGGAFALVPETDDGDVTVTAPWIKTTAIQERFLAEIWEPLKALKPEKNPSSTLLFARIRARNTKSLGVATNPEDWHLLLPELQAFNMAMLQPKATKIEPHWGPITGGQPIGLKVTITGSDFIAQTTALTLAPAPLVLETTVAFGVDPGTSVNVINHTSLEVVPPPLPVPLNPGPVDVVVTTPGGSSSPALQFLYINDPLAINDVSAAGSRGALSPRVVSTRGNDSFQILGQGFLPGATVEISTVPVASRDVKILQPTLIEVVQTPVRAPGIVDVGVKNPDGASAILNGRLRFADPPEIVVMLKPASRSGPANQDNDITISGLNIAPNATLTDGTQSLPITITPVGGTTEVDFTLPAGSPGLVNFELENPSDGLSAQFDFLREDVGP
jgi:hypothetical protein